VISGGADFADFCSASTRQTAPSVRPQEFFLNSEYSAIAEVEDIVHNVISVQTVLEMQAA
jgi:hypothetical protein